MKRKSLFYFFAAVFLSAFLSGCQDMQLRDRVEGALSRRYAIENFYLDPEVTQDDVRRILVVMPRDLSGARSRDSIAGKAGEKLILELQRCKKFDVLPAQGNLTPEQEALISAIDLDKQGSYDADRLFELARSLNIQGVLFSSVTQYQPKEPLRFGMKLHLIQIRKGKIIWAADEIFDSSREDVKNLARAHYYESADVSQSPSVRWRLILTSMDDFIGFYLSEVLSTYAPRPSFQQ